MHESPLISIIVPVYNAEKALQKCLQSISAQTYHKLELIIINDCSTDNSLQIVYDHFNTLQNKKEILLKIIHHKKNRGVAAARNTGLDNATGDYIYYVDADDWIEPDTLQCLLNKALLTDADILGHELWFQYEKERHIKLPDIETGEEAFTKMANGELRWNLWLYFVKKSLYEENNIRFLEGMNMGEDMMVMGKLFLCAKKTSVVHKPFYHYTAGNPTSLTKEKSAARIQQMTTNLKALEDFVTKYKDKEFYKNVQYLILQAKLPLLFSNDVEDYKTWRNWFPEANRYAQRNKASSFRNRFLQYMAAKKMHFVLKWHYRLTNFFIKLLFH